MDLSFPGLGTAINTVAVAAGALLGMAAGGRFSDATRELVTDCLGLVTLLMAGLSAMAVTDRAFTDAVGTSAPVLIVLGSLVGGGILGSMLGIEARLASAIARAERGLGASRGKGSRSEASSDRFVQGWLTSTLLFCVGPLTILGSLNDGLGRGIDQLMVKSALDFFASIAFGSSFGLGVVCSAGSVLVVQGALTLAGMLLGTVMPEAQVAALTATGGLLLAGIGLRLLDIKHMRVADALPALAVAPLLTAVVAHLM